MCMLKSIEWVKEKKREKNAINPRIHVKAVWNLLRSLLHLARFAVVVKNVTFAHTRAPTEKNRPDNAY